MRIVEDSIKIISNREDSASICCKQNCEHLSTYTDLVKITKEDKIAYDIETRSKCLKFMSELKLSFGRVHKCFDCVVYGSIQVKKEVEERYHNSKEYKMWQSYLDYIRTGQEYISWIEFKKIKEEEMKEM